MATVLLVMKRPGNVRVMAQVLEAGGHTAVTIPDHQSLITVLTETRGSPIALVDSSGFGPSDWEICQVLRDYDVRFIVLCGGGDLHSPGQAMSYWAAGFLQKPVRKPVLLRMLSGMAEASDKSNHTEVDGL